MGLGFLIHKMAMVRMCRVVLGPALDIRGCLQEQARNGRNASSLPLEQCSSRARAPRPHGPSTSGLCERANSDLWDKQCKNQGGFFSC